MKWPCIQQHLDSYLSIPKSVNQNNAEAVRLGLLDLQNPTQLERTFWQQIQAFPAISYIYFGQAEAGGYVDAGRQEDGTMVIEATEGFVAGNYNIYTTDEMGNRQALISTDPGYDPRKRPWYLKAVASAQPIWSDVYTLFPDYLLGITATVPIYDSNQQLQGVLGADLTLSQISHFLQGLKVSKSGETFIIERSGLIIATSTDQTPFVTDSNSDQPERLNAALSPDLLIRAATEQLLERFEDLGQIQHSQQFKFDLQGRRQFLQVTPFQDSLGLDWLIVVTVPESDFMAQITANTHNTILLCLGSFMLAIALGILTARRITQPVLRLAAASQAIAEGNLDQTVAIHNIYELNVLAQSFNQMAQQLQDSFAELAETNAQLENRVEARTAELSQALVDLRRTQAQLVQTEKMSSLGQLVAGVAHEINNPVNFIHGNLSHASEYVHSLLHLVNLYQTQYPVPTAQIANEIEEIDLEFLKGDFPRLIGSMNVGAERIREIVKSLRTFSRLDEAEFKSADIHEGIDSTLLILHNRLKDTPTHPGIQIIRDYGQLPWVECYPGQLNQVFMNLLTNAIDALEEHNQNRTVAEMEAHPSTIKIVTTLHKVHWVIVRIIDNGPGMSETVRDRLFDPFFTTKAVGKGTGLGLSISYQVVVEKHRGKIWCNPAPEQGTEFGIQIPVSHN